MSPELSGAPVPASGYVAWIPEEKSSAGMEGGQGEDGRTGSAYTLSPRADLIGIPVESDLGPHSPHLRSGLGSGALSDF